MNAPQGSEAWRLARAGHCTASCFKDVLARIKVGEAAGRRNYRMQLVTERLTGIPQDDYTNAAMQWGIEQEPYARESYENETGNMVLQSEFVKGEEWTGCSPDGLIGTDGLTQIKCPFKSVIHLETLTDGIVPSEHVAQIQGELWVTGREWSDFVSFDPRMPEKLRLFVKRVQRDEDYIAKLAAEVNAFLVEVEKLHQQILRMA